MWQFRNPCDNIQCLCARPISIFQLVSNLISHLVSHKSNLIDTCALLVRMASVNAGSPCEIHRTDPRVDSKNMYHYYCICLLNNKCNETQAIHWNWILYMNFCVCITLHVRTRYTHSVGSSNLVIHCFRSDQEVLVSVQGDWSYTGLSSNCASYFRGVSMHSICMPKFSWIITYEWSHTPHTLAQEQF